jgi:hypothetical protein
MPSYTVSDDKVKVPNQVSWAGVGPPADGDFIAYSGETNGTVTLYTVVAGYELHLYNCYVDMRWSTGAAEGYMEIQDTVPVTVYVVLRTSCQSTGDSHSSSLARMAPLIVPAGYLIRLRESGLCYMAGGFEGYLVKV